jgi:alpha-tubulin suppressor-like RCC1 family protein
MICGEQRDGSLGGPCANDRAGTNKSTTTEDTEDTEVKNLKQDLCVLFILCGGEFLVII